MKVGDVFSTRLELKRKVPNPRRWKIIEIDESVCAYIKYYGYHNEKKLISVPISLIREHFKSGTWVIITPKLKRI